MGAKKPENEYKVRWTLSKNAVFVVPEVGTTLLAIPWFFFSEERLLEYTKLAFLTDDPKLDKATSRQLQAQFLNDAQELKGLLQNGDDLLRQPDSHPVYSDIVSNCTTASNRTPPNIFGSVQLKKEKVSAMPEALSDTQLQFDVNLIRTLGVTSKQRAYNQKVRAVQRETGEKYAFRSPTQSMFFDHSAPEKVRPGVQSSREHIDIKDFRNLIHTLADMDIEKKDLPPIWYKLIQNLVKCQGITKTGIKERDALLNSHALAFLMKMTFNLTNLLDKLSQLRTSGSLRVREADKKTLGSYFMNFELSRDLLHQFEMEFYEFFQKSTWSDLSVFEKKVKVAEFYHHFSLNSAETPQIWSRGNFGIFMSSEARSAWQNYFLHKPASKDRDAEPRANFHWINAQTKGNPSKKGVTGNGLTQTKQNSNNRGRGRGRKNNRGRNKNRGGRRKNRRGRGRGRGKNNQDTPKVKTEEGKKR